MIIDDELLDEVSVRAKDSERLRMNYNFHESLESKAQRLLNALIPGTVLPVHRHLNNDETFILLRGRLDVVFYNDNKEEIQRYELDNKKGNYGIHIPKTIWHTVEVYEPSVIFEVKDGPYVPLGKDEILF